MMKFVGLLGLLIVAASPRAFADPSPWNGAWTLDQARSTAGASEFAAPGYVFEVDSAGEITWRIPSIGEVAVGQTDGQPMTVTRRVPSPGLALSVRAEGPLLFRYQVLRNGVAEGEGLMRLVEGGQAWVDISWRVDKPELAGELVYARDGANGSESR